ncbi:MAG: TadE/TadG family type IV pilus assembly protein [Actinomycetota bacterium]
MGERGSTSLEAVLLVPVLIVVLGITLGLGRVVAGRNDADDAAREAARAASLTRSAADAGAAASGAAARRLAADESVCRDPAIETDTTGFHPGGTVAVSVTCSVDLAGTHLPARARVMARSVQPLDPFRGLQ